MYGYFQFFSKDKKEKLDQGLSKTKESFFTKVNRAIAGKSKVDDQVLDELEEILIGSDVGVDTTLRIIERIEKRIERDKYLNTDELYSILREETVELLIENDQEASKDFIIPEDTKPYVIMVVGVNGVGKTTTIGKLAYQYTQRGKKSVHWSGRHIQGGSHRAIMCMGRKGRSECCKTSNGLGSGFGSIRYPQFGA